MKSESRDKNDVTSASGKLLDELKTVMEHSEKKSEDATKQEKSLEQKIWDLAENAGSTAERRQRPVEEVMQRTLDEELEGLD